MDLKTLVAQLVGVFERLERNQRIVVALTIASIIAFLVFLVIYTGNSGGRDGYKVLFEKLSSADAAKVIEQLEKDEIDYRIVRDRVIEVPEEYVYTQRIKIAAMGIPKESNVGFELFDVQEFGATAFDQKVKYLRALEGELSRTITGLNPVESAKVHIALPKESLFVSEQQQPTASIVLKFKEEMRLSRSQIQGIKHLVAASIIKMRGEDVTIVNAEGEPLGGSDDYDNINEDVKIQLRYKTKMELLYEEKIVNVLAPFIGGVDRVVAKVTIDFDFSKRSSTKEVYDPENVVRSEQILEEKRDGGSSPEQIGGVPGVVSNIGPVQGLEDDSKSGEKYEKNSVATNYEISKTVSNTTGEFAIVRRITAAVVVDGKYKEIVSEDGKVAEKKEYIPLDQSQVAAINNLVNSAIGIDLNRGDQVSVTNFQFISSLGEFEAPVDKVVYKINSYLGPLVPMLKYLFVFIILFVIYKKMVVPFAERMLEISEVDDETERPVLALDDDDDEDLVGKVQEMRKKVEDQLGITGDYNEDELKYDVLLEKIKTMVEEKNEEIATILQALIFEESGFEERK